MLTSSFKVVNDIFSLFLLSLKSIYPYFLIISWSLSMADFWLLSSNSLTMEASSWRSGSAWMIRDSRTLTDSSMYTFFGPRWWPVNYCLAWWECKLASSVKAFRADLVSSGAYYYCRLAAAVVAAMLTPSTFWLGFMLVSGPRFW